MDTHPRWLWQTDCILKGVQVPCRAPTCGIETASPVDRARGGRAGGKLAFRMRSLFLALSLLLFAVSALAQSTGAVQVAIRIPAVGFVDLDRNSEAAEVLRPAQPGPVSMVQVRVRSGASGRVVILLLLRSNTAYQLFVRAQPSESVSGRPSTVSPVLVVPNAGGRHVMPGGSQARTATAVLRSMGQEDLLLEGSRISCGGNNDTPDNALLIQLEVTLPDDLPEADFLFSLKIQ